jgi:hypothetical protein
VSTPPSADEHWRRGRSSRYLQREINEAGCEEERIRHCCYWRGTTSGLQSSRTDELFRTSKGGKSIPES